MRRELQDSITSIWHMTQPYALGSRFGDEPMILDQNPSPTHDPSHSYTSGCPAGYESLLLTGVGNPILNIRS
ncbi:MAG: hypothetical protein DRJ28_06705, partial [Actinobacteria bacterium]